MSWPNHQGFPQFPMQPGQVPQQHGQAPQYVVCMVPVHALPAMAPGQGMVTMPQQAVGHQDSDGQHWYGMYGGAQHQPMQQGRGRAGPGDQGGGGMDSSLSMPPGGQHHWGSSHNQSFQQQAGGGWNTSATPFEPSDRNSDNRMPRPRPKNESGTDTASRGKYVPPALRGQQAQQQMQPQQQTLAPGPGAMEKAAPEMRPQMPQMKKGGLRNAPIGRPEGAVNSVAPSAFGDQQPEATGQPVQQLRQDKLAQDKVMQAWSERPRTISALGLESARMQQSSFRGPPLTNSTEGHLRSKADEAVEPSMDKHHVVD
jgi:hypothetical protein